MTLSLFAGTAIDSLDSSDAQSTPDDLCAELGHFDTDPCTNPHSAIQATTKYMLEHGQDGLALPWFGSTWCNGPYSNPLPWCERLRAHDAPWASLWKLDCTTEWFRQALAPGPRGQRAQWAPFRHRLAFKRAGNTAAANFCSVLIWRDWDVPAAVQHRLWMPGGHV